MITAAIAAYIFIVYRLITKKTFYSKNFNIALAGIAVVTAGIILAVQSSIVIYAFCSGPSRWESAAEPI